MTNFLTPLSSPDGPVLDTEVVKNLVVHFAEGLMNSLENYNCPRERMVFVKGAVLRNLNDAADYREACLRLSTTFQAVGKSRPNVFHSLLKAFPSLPELVSFAQVSSPYFQGLILRDNEDPNTLLRLIASLPQKELKALRERVTTMDSETRLAFDKKVLEYTQVTPEDWPLLFRGGASSHQFAAALYRVAGPLLKSRNNSLQARCDRLSRLVNVPIDERESVSAEIQSSLLFKHQYKLGYYWDKALDLSGDERHTYLTQADDVINILGVNRCPSVDQLVHGVYAQTPENRALIHKYTQKIVEEFRSYQTRSILLQALLQAKWKNAEECDVFMNSALALAKGFENLETKPSIPHLLYALRMGGAAYTDPSFIPDLLPVLLTATEVCSSQLISHLEDVDSASRQQIARLVADAFKGKKGNIGKLEPVINALKKIESSKVREEVMQAAAPFIAQVKLASQHAQVIDALPTIAASQRGAFVAQCLAEAQTYKDNAGRLKTAIKRASANFAQSVASAPSERTKRGRTEQSQATPLDLSGSSSSSAPSSNALDDDEENETSTAASSSSNSSDVELDDATTWTKRARTN